jgi:RNA polymerase sigma-70 factor (ECF subfamily)
MGHRSGFMEERELVKRAKRGDVDAFGRLYESVYKKMYQYALYTLKNQHDAEDVVSETVTDAFAAIRSLRSEEAFSGWIFAILSNKCRHRMKDYYRMRTEDMLEEEEAGESESILQRSDAYDSDWSRNKEAYHDVREAFFELQEEERMILGMHIFLGYRTREIAAQLSMNENTVRSRESRALQKLKRRVLPDT